ncbi:hypothetical protein RRG08_038262 [Elysia crispata]|uniref:Uncharacterized protein n=1 Tax=Elysia crispata TaxID=231223 RepID=A0AAE1E1E8_9GAST|nr:hypothetical protein RRG08_038262 [Elysia crispata]
MSGSNNLHSSPGHHRLGLYSVLSIIQDLQSWPLQVGNPLISWTRLNDVCLFSLDACVRFIWLTRIIPQFPPLDPTFRVFPIADLYADKLRSRSLSSALFAAVISPEPPDQTRPVKVNCSGRLGVQASRCRCTRFPELDEMDCKLVSTGIPRSLSSGSRPVDRVGIACSDYLGASWDRKGIACSDYVGASWHREGIACSDYVGASWDREGIT